MIVEMIDETFINSLKWQYGKKSKYIKFLL